MKWNPDGDKAIIREDGKFRIFRSPQAGHAPGKPVYLALVDTATHEVIAEERDVTPERQSVYEATQRLAKVAANA